MTKKILAIITYLFVITSDGLVAQNCSNYFESEGKEQSTDLNSISQTIAEREKYSYSLQFIRKDKGYYAQLVSKSGVILKDDDEIIFMNADRERLRFPFATGGQMQQKEGISHHSNSITLRKEDLYWLANANIISFYIKDNEANEMRKFNIDPTYQSRLKELAACFAKKTAEIRD